ncbi:hypothetical protein M3P36_08775 [Altererythrobacter sp. KTW20L]|uniref:hypothetical protein n=1 Tax=Altererythrobacter sp. KTW20L TaxID=2942210 RepID=UPI0020C1167A|nr:hypothetical protein [Altererythrobacter sp. KTW20L]MCL6251134.1 hypothetical protein [Altererythrobacter sp. KTW20L]
MADNTAKPRTSKPRAAKAASATSATTSNTSPRSEARSRFNAALEEAKAGAAALKTEATGRATTYADDARAKSEDWAAEARVKAAELAAEGKNKAGEALVSLSRVVEENAPAIDEKLGQKYGDYARNASRSLSDTASTLQGKSVEDLGEDAREYVRQNPGKSVGIAVLAGYIISRIFRR